MNDWIRGHIAKHNEKGGCLTDDAIRSALLYGHRVYRRELIRLKYYSRYLYVVEIGGRFIGYEGLESFGIYEMNLDDDDECGLDTVREMRPVEKTVTVYENVTEGQDDGDNDTN